MIEITHIAGCLRFLREYSS